MHVDFERIRERERSILQAEHSLNTRSAYRSAWKAFNLWCAATGLDPLPALPQTVKDFATWCINEGYRLETVNVRVSAVGYYHRRAASPSPVDGSVREYVVRAKREAKEQPRSKKALTIDMLRRVSRYLARRNGPLNIRNRAMILVCFAAGWRRSEVVSLQMGDVQFTETGVSLWLRSSKSDQTAEGRLVGLPSGKRKLTCPVLALKAWLDIRGEWDGPLFVRINVQQQITREALAANGHALYCAVKDVLKQIGENPDYFGAHSLRAGMITEASKNGASESAIMQRTGHKRYETLRRYIRPAHAFDFDPLKGVL